MASASSTLVHLRELSELVEAGHRRLAGEEDGGWGMGEVRACKYGCAVGTFTAGQ